MNIVLKNFSYLAILQLVNVVAPLLIYPVIINRVGVNQFGNVILAQSAIYYLTIFVNYGLNIYGTKLISGINSKVGSYNEVFNNIFYFKLFVSIMISALVILSWGLIESINIIYVFSLGIVFGDLLLPIWFYQGIERMKYITIISSLSKIIYIALVYFYVQDESDGYLLASFLSISLLVGGVLSMIIAMRKYGVIIGKPNLHGVYAIGVNGFPYFGAMFTRDSYIRATPILIGLVAGSSILAYYDFANKCVSAYKSILSAVSQAAFPYIIRTQNYSKVMYVLLCGLLVSIVFYCLSVIISSELLEFFFNEVNTQAIVIFRIALIAVLFITISNLCSQLVLIPLGKGNLFFYISAITCIVYFALIWTLYLFDVINGKSIIWVSVFVEFFLAFCYLYMAISMKVLRRKNDN
ncbi:oligosaccharide flippase family protein [Cobetia sp. 5-25-4-2]|uniref:oligosaccharide flippase family protein n=1 Tax=Cobetia sp. 5-25-4-2 TaxID=2737459 RepID=UPI001596B9D4|nr:oligosaccharide flippase family protein [Cobetia sp. 5-25-4-2]